jgi:hypothetical protein
MKETASEALTRIRKERQAMLPVIHKSGIACQKSDDPIKMWRKKAHLVRRFNQLTIEEERILNKIDKNEQKKAKKKYKKKDMQLVVTFDNLTIGKEEK